MISTPSGLTQGETFFVVFVDSTRHAATSTSIADYNGFIQTDASGITYAGGTIGTWQVIGATEASNAATGLFSNQSTPVYDVKSTQLSTSGVSYLTSGVSPFIDQNGNSLSGEFVWTGLAATGATSANNALGANTDFTEIGAAGQANPTPGLVDGAFENIQGQAESLYGYALFTVGPATSAVPEPSSVTLAFVGVVGLVVGRGVRRCRRASASGPTACPPTHS